MIGLLAAVAIILLLCLTTYFDQSVSVLDIVVWVFAAVAVVAGAWRLLGGWGGGAGTASAKPQARGPSAEGLARLRRGDLDTAQRLLEQCLERDPEDGEAARGLADIVLRRGDADRYVQIVSRILARPDALPGSDRVALCHRQADVYLGQLDDPQRAVEALARIELDYPGTTDASRARRRIEQILSQPERGAEN